MTDLRALAERLKKATGPDREIDLDLMVLGWGGPRDQYLTDELGRLDFGCQHQFTASIDAAVALCERVLPGCHWSVTNAATKPRANVWMPEVIRPIMGPYSSAPTPALALCLAVVRARLAESGHA